jgi:hypothetical protein
MEDPPVNGQAWQVRESQPTNLLLSVLLSSYKNNFFVGRQISKKMKSKTQT